MKKLWKQFEKLTARCYINLAEDQSEDVIWDQAFDALVQIVENGQKKSVDFPSELYILDDHTDFKYGIEEWFDDYLDDLDCKERYEKLEQVCQKMLDLFQWKDSDPSELKFHIASALDLQGKAAEALAFCETWYNQEQDNDIAVTALLLVKMTQKDMEGAQRLINAHIKDDTVCDDTNCMLFSTAMDFYKIVGDKKSERKINQALQKYEKEVEEFLTEIFDGLELGFSEEDDEMAKWTLEDGELPF